MVPDLKPSEAMLPLTKLPGLGLPTPIPVPNLQRLYFKFCTPIDTRTLKQAKGRGKGDAAWQEIYDGIKKTGGQGMRQ